MPRTKRERELLTPEAAAGLLGVSRVTLWRYVKDHLLEVATKTAGGHARYRRADVERLREVLAAKPSRAAEGITKVNIERARTEPEDE